jgi:hypothetical protein
LAAAVAVVLDSSDIAGAIGVPFASATDEAWADLAVGAAMDFVAPLPVANDISTERQAAHGALMLAVWLYKRRPMGTVEPGWEFTPTSDEVTAFYTLLQLGRHSPPVIA